MKKSAILLFIMLTHLTNVSAQADLQSAYEIRHAFDFYKSTNSQAGILNPSIAAESIKGSPYLNDEFINGKVYTTSKIQFVDIPLRYNIYNDQVEFKNGNDQLFAIGAPETVELVEIGETRMEYIPFQAGNKISKGFFVVLEKGSASLYCRQEVELESGKRAAAYQDAQPPQFIRKSDTFYIKISGEPAKPVSKKKDLQKIFANKGKDVSTYITKRKVRPDDQESLIELVAFYNAL